MTEYFAALKRPIGQPVHERGTARVAQKQAHVKNLFAKLDVETRAQAVAHAREIDLHLAGLAVTSRL